LVCGGRYNGYAEPSVVEALAWRVSNAEPAFFDGGLGFLNQDPAAFFRIAAFLGCHALRFNKIEGIR